MSCNGCRVLRKGCSESCILRPCLQWIDTPESQGHATVFVAKFFGRAGLMSFISNVPDSQRPGNLIHHIPLTFFITTSTRLHLFIYISNYTLLIVFFFYKCFSFIPVSSIRSMRPYSKPSKWRSRITLDRKLESLSSSC